MKDFLLDALLKPFLAILFCLAFGVPFVYVGFQTVHVEGTRDGDGTVTIDFTRRHFWGVYKIDRHVEGVTGADLSTSRLRRIGNRHRLVSGVFLTTPSETVALFAGSSNIDDDLKWDVVDTINEFVHNPTGSRLVETFQIRNVFGWVGIPFFLLGVLGLLGWPASILRYASD